MIDQDKFIKLADHVGLRLLETPCLYDRRADELYELNDDGLEGLKRCNGAMTVAQAALEPEFLQDCLDEGLLVLFDQPRPQTISLSQSPVPSLRYLEVQVTWRCNLACRHCYLGKARAVDMAPDDFRAVVEEFEAMGGLRLMISGGEPLAHPQWPEINAVLDGLPVRRVLLSNGGLLTPEIMGQLNFDEVQISIDGLQKGHDMLRGKGSFERAVAAARLVRTSGLDLSVATMAHSGNLGEMDGLEELVRSLEALEWGIDAPVISGRLSDNPELAVTPVQAAQAMTRAYGGAFHGGSGGMACGLHLCTVAADGKVAQCGFYFDDPLGSASEGLRACWQRREPLALADIAGCRDCDVADDCGGGCRFRAADRLSPDPVMCAAMGKELQQG